VGKGIDVNVRHQGQKEALMCQKNTSLFNCPIYYLWIED